MTEDRFIAMARAFGSDLRRWPGAEREAAAAFVAAHPEAAGLALAAERRLDETLDAHAASSPSAELRRRIIDAAPRQRALGRALRWIAGAGLGLGLAASCAAGVAAGMTLAPEGVSQLISGTGDGGGLSSLADPLGDAANG